jgi:hypothetical protein
MHRLNYGSIKINWEPPVNNPGIGRVSINCRCVCGQVLVGEGVTFVEAARRLEQRLSVHAEADAAGGAAHHQSEAQ